MDKQPESPLSESTSNSGLPTPSHWPRKDPVYLPHFWVPGHPARVHWKGKMPSTEIMDHILRKAQLDYIVPRVLNNRQLRMSISFCGGIGFEGIHPRPLWDEGYELDDHTVRDWTRLGVWLAVTFWPRSVCTLCSQGTVADGRRAGAILSDCGLYGKLFMVPSLSMYVCRCIVNACCRRPLLIWTV